MTEGKNGDNWYIIPEFVDLERLMRILPATAFKVSKLAFKEALITSIKLHNAGISFTIAETPEGRLMNGLDGLTEMGYSSLQRFLQIYWRYIFEDMLRGAGYHIEHKTYNKSNGSFSMTSYKEQGVI